MVSLYDSGIYLVNGTETVSYTHLDVYKRQMYLRGTSYLS